MIWDIQKFFFNFRNTSFYFGGRTLEKIMDMKKGKDEPKQ